jgi:histidinol-phosphate aminotransferase
MTLSLWEIEEIIKSNPDNVVLIDEAYVDFGAESCVDLIRKYDNLLVCQTFSKSRSMAGARLGVALASEGIIRDMNTLKYSINPYNVNRMSQRAGIAAVQSNDYYMANCRTIAENRAYTAEKLTELGFTVLPSKANFIFVASEVISGGEYYEKLKAMGVLVRHFTKPTIANFCRITIGTREQMDVLLEKTKQILAEKGC